MMGPTKAIRYLEADMPAGVQENRSRFLCGHRLHQAMGFYGEVPVRKKKRIAGTGVILYAVGVPDMICPQESLVVEFKTYTDRRNIAYQVQRGIFQASFYCWMLSFERFRLLLYNTETGRIDVVVERNFDQAKFLKKLRKAIRMVRADTDTGLGKAPQKKKKRQRQYLWLMRFFDGPLMGFLYMMAGHNLFLMIAV